MKKFSAPLLVAFGALLAVSIGCSDSTQPEPPLVEPPGTQAAAPRVLATYLGKDGRYILHEDSTFAFQAASAARYPGRYLQADSLITFTFEKPAQPWYSFGTLRGDSLVVQYNEAMLANGGWGGDSFEDGVYVRTPSPEHIYLAHSDGSAIVWLTRGGWPDWSPDGSKIAFHRAGDIYVINTDGSGEMRLVSGSYPAWAPDGSRIVFASDEGISVIHADGSGLTTLIRHDFRDDTYAASDMGVSKPAWSPGGRRIAFEHLGDGDLIPAQTFVMNADGSGPRLLTTSRDRRQYAESDPAWSPDGVSIVLWRYDLGIATVNANGGVPNSIYTNFPAVAYGAKPDWSPDGIIAFNTFKGASGEAEIWTVPATGSGAKVLIRNGYGASWSPDGSKIAFVSRRGE